MTDSKALVWLRNNLRLADNTALMKALGAYQEVILIYVFDIRHWELNPIGLKTSSNNKIRFLWETVNQLKKQVESKGGSLIILKGKPEVEIENMVEQFSCSAVYTTEEAGVYEATSLDTLEKALMPKGIAVYTFQESTLYHPEDIPWPINKLPKVFTEFRKENENQTIIRAVKEEPTDLAKTYVRDLSSISANDFSIDICKSEPNGLRIEGGEQAAYDRIDHYFWQTDGISKYKETRNGLMGLDYSSKLSPWLANGSLSPRVLYRKLKLYEQERGENESTYWLFFELLWRDFFHFILKKHGMQLFSKNGIQTKNANWNHTKELFNKWCKGETGVPFVDANMKELNTTGFMSNRGRQLVASFLTHDLNIDWRWGAWYFERQLIDYDVASNWGNWAYVAGVGNDPRKNRYFNILSQAKKYDPEGEYVRQWIPELADIKGFDIHKAALLDDSVFLEKLKDAKECYRKPVVDMNKWDY